MAGSIRRSVGLKLLHRVPLVVPREDDLLRSTPRSDRALLRAVDMNEAMKDVEPGVLGPDPLPEVGRLVAVGIRRIALAQVVTKIERKEARRLPIGLRGLAN